MKLLLDACVWGEAAAELASNGHDVVWAGDWVSDPGDEEILARAHADVSGLVNACAKLLGPRLALLI